MKNGVIILVLFTTTVINAFGVMHFREERDSLYRGYMRLQAEKDAGGFECQARIKNYDDDMDETKAALMQCNDTLDSVMVTAAHEIKRAITLCPHLAPEDFVSPPDDE